VGSQRLHGVERKPRRPEAQGAPRPETAHSLMALQRSAGNAAVARALSVQRAPAKEDELGGIGARFAVDQYAGVAKKLETVWGRLTPYSRASALVNAANFELAHIDVPNVELKLDKLDSAQAVFAKEDWKMTVDRGTMSSPTVDDATMGESASYVYHEARHAEQAFLVARLLAGRKLKVDEIVDTFEIRADIAAQAAKQPLRTPGRERTLAKRVLASEAGAGKTHNVKLFEDWRAIEKNLDAAELAWKNAPEGPAKDKAREKLDLEQAAYDAAYKEYREQAHEADAWKVGDAVKGRIDPPKTP
jgi:hypothetical protein